jgi:transposase
LPDAAQGRVERDHAALSPHRTVRLLLTHPDHLREDQHILRDQLAAGLERDRAAVDAALTLPHHNGRTEGVNNKIKLIERQMYGRAGPALLHQRILLS